MHRAARQDSNHAEIRQVFVDAGLSTLDLHQLKGACDLLVGGLGVNILLEIKDGTKPPSKRQLSEKERDFHARWLGPLFIVETVEQAQALANQLTSIESVETGETVH
jgi:hypothetical protein